jgi:NADH:ubiquinone oxidoreductase subunit 3 (subunit A)
MMVAVVAVVVVLMVVAVIMLVVVRVLQNAKKYTWIQCSVYDSSANTGTA